MISQLESISRTRILAAALAVLCAFAVFAVSANSAHADPVCDIGPHCNNPDSPPPPLPGECGNGENTPPPPPPGSGGQGNPYSIGPRSDLPPELPPFNCETPAPALPANPVEPTVTPPVAVAPQFTAVMKSTTGKGKKRILKLTITLNCSESGQFAFNNARGKTVKTASLNCDNGSAKTVARFSSRQVKSIRAAGGKLYVTATTGSQSVTAGVSTRRA